MSLSRISIVYSILNKKITQDLIPLVSKHCGTVHETPQWRKQTPLFFITYENTSDNKCEREHYFIVNRWYQGNENQPYSRWYANITFPDYHRYINSINSILTIDDKYSLYNEVNKETICMLKGKPYHIPYCIIYIHPHPNTIFE